MKQITKLLFLSLILFFLLTCGADYQSQSDTGSITMQIIWQVPNEFQTNNVNFDYEEISYSKSPSFSNNMPASVQTIRFTVTGLGMSTATQTFPASERYGVISGILVGENRTLKIDALDSSNSVIYSGTRTNITVNKGQLNDIGTVVLSPTDNIPPTFSGLTSATAVNSTQIDLSWSSASDNVTETDDIVYLIYQSTTSGSFNYSSPTYTTSAGATGYLVTGLNPSTTYYFIVRARDESGNIDNNTIQSFATTLETSESLIEMILVNPLSNPHGVTQSYYIGKYPVTNQEYAYVLNWAYSEGKINNSHTYPDRISWNSSTSRYTVSAGFEKHPVTSVSYNDAGIWCNLLSEMEGLTSSFAGVSSNSSGNFNTSVNGYRLPENGEWTYVAIGPNAEQSNSSLSWYYPWEAPNTNLEQRMNYWNSNDPWEGISYPRTTPVGFFNGTIQQKSYWNWPGSSSSFTTVSNASYTGAYDMAGNVWEWTGQVSSTYRVLRGGSWSNNTSNCRVSNRHDFYPSYRNGSYGFRVVRSFSESSSDNTPPTFSGLTSATAVSSTQINLSWTAASDNVTSSDDIVYLIYQSTTSDSFNYSSPTYTTSAGTTSYFVSGLNPSTIYYFVVRAKDEAGNIDDNSIQHFATTLQTFSSKIEMIFVEPLSNPHGVTQSYYIGKYPVTNEEYAYVLNWAYSEGKISNPLDYASSGSITDRISWNFSTSRYTVNEGYEKHPVTRVSYNDAGIWCNLLSEMEGLTLSFAGVSSNASGNFNTTVNGYRLPEEGEWTYAAIGSNVKITNWEEEHLDWYYPWEAPNSNLHQRMNYWDSNDPWEGINNPRTTPVGFYNGTIQQKSNWDWTGSATSFTTLSNASYIRAYDMAGNVWEWTGQIGGLSNDRRVLCGGSWSDLSSLCGVSNRPDLTPSLRFDDCGFRVVRSF